MTHVLFVDDDERVLRGIRRTMRSSHPDWEMSFAGDSEEALAQLEEKGADVIVSDAQMPGVDGLALLQLVRMRHPETARIMLTGQVKKDQTYELQALGIAFGDLLAEQLGLEWVSVEDELGRTRALQYGDSENFVFPVTMISKRVEADVRFTVAELYEKTRSTVEAFRKEPGSTRRLSL